MFFVRVSFECRVVWSECVYENPPHFTVPTVILDGK